MRIFVAGGTGFLGTYLCKVLIAYGHEVTLLARRPNHVSNRSAGIRIVQGTPLSEGDWQQQLTTFDAVINLTGTSIFQPWTRAVKEAIHESRVVSTAHIVDALLRTSAGGTVLLNASGVGYYGSSGNGIVTESSGPGSTFLGQVASTWEKTALRAKEAGIRVVLCRFGIVLGKQGGAFPKLARLTRFHLTAPWGSGTQWFPWIHEKDVARIVMFLLEHDDIRGPVNVAAPGPVQNREMAVVLNDVLRKKPLVPMVPAWLLRSALGEFSYLFLAGQRALPDVLIRHGFAFQFSTFREAVVELLHY